MFILFGFVRFSINWTTGKMAVAPITIVLFGASAATQSPYSPWMVSFALPVGAVVFWIKRRRLMSSPSPAPPEQNGIATSKGAELNYSFTIASATDRIFGFASNALNLDLGHFANPLDGGIWSIAQHGNNLDLVFTNASAIPVPSTYAAIFGVSALGIAIWRRRRVGLGSHAQRIASAT